MMNKLRSSEKDDDLFSNEDDDMEENYINKKQLIHLENDKSVTIDDSYLDEELLTNRRSMTPINFLNKKKQNRINNPHEDLLKFITDTSDIIYGGDNFNSSNANNNWNAGAGLKNYLNTNNKKNELSTNKFEIYLPAINPIQRSLSSSNLEKDKFFTLQSQSQQSQSSNSFRVSNNYKEKYEFIEGKYKDLSNAYNNLVDNLKEWQIFYIKIFNILNMPLPTDNAYNAIFTDKYKNEMVNHIETVTEKANKIGIFQGLKVCLISNMNLECYKKLNNFTMPVGNSFSLIQSEDKLFHLNFIRFKDLFIDNQHSFNLVNIKKFVPASVSASTHSKQIKVYDEDYDNLPPFSTRSSHIKKKEIFILESNRLEIINKKLQESKYSRLLITNRNNFNLIAKIIEKKSIEIQTNFNKFDIDKVYALNEEYSQQLIFYKNEKEEMGIMYKNEIFRLQEEIKKSEDVLFTEESSDKLNIFMFPEMIPPENTFKIFLHCVRHFKYEDEMYKKYILMEDINSIKNFLDKMEAHVEKSRSKSRSSSFIKKKIKKEKKFITDGVFQSSIKRINFQDTNDQKNNNLIYSKYKSMLQSITSSKKAAHNANTIVKK